MAGLRIGYAFGSRKLIARLNDVKFSFNSYTMDWFTQILGAEAVKDEEYFKACTAKIVKTREWVKEELGKLGLTFPDSKTNFIFAKHASLDGETIFQELKKRNIYVRHWNKDRISDYLRITIGTDEQMKILLAALKEIIGEA